MVHILFKDVIRDRERSNEKQKKLCIRSRWIVIKAETVITFYSHCQVINNFFFPFVTSTQPAYDKVPFI